MSRSVNGEPLVGAGVEPVVRSETACRGDDLKGLLQRLSEQIADADRRHSESMRDMQARLVRLGGEAGQVKATLPEQHAAAFERIEGGMAELAERLADGGRGRAQPGADFDPNAIRADAIGVDAAAPAAPAPAYPPDDRNAASDRHEVPPLLSAVATGAPAAAPVGAADPGRATGGFQHYPDDPWDQHSAAALARLYDSGEPGLPPRLSPDDLPTEPLAPVAAATPARAGMAAGQPADAPPAAAVSVAAGSLSDAGASAQRGAQVELEWLEDRLADVARRVELSLAELKPESSLIALGQRFDEFEQRFTSVLEDVATRSDVEGLRLVEAHISELTIQLEQARAQLGRLDGIEAQFAELRDKLTDDQIVALFGGLVPTEQDLTRFAEEAAGKVADRVIAQLPLPGGHVAAVAAEPDTRTLAQIESLHGLLSSFIDERRRGEASTADALDAMQLAMRQMLDRVDALETLASAVPTLPAMPLEEAPAQLSKDAGVALPAAARLEEKERLATELRSFAEEARAAAAHAAMAQPGGARLPQRDMPVEGEHHADLANAPAARLPATPGRGPAGPSGPGHSSAPDPFDRARFVALARQAAEKAQSASDPRGKAPANEAGDRAPVKLSIKDRLGGAAGGDAEGTGKPAVRPGVLLVASVALLLMVGSVFVLPKLRGTTAPTGAEPTLHVPAKTRGPQSRNAPALEDDAEPQRPPPRPQSLEPAEEAPRAPAERQASGGPGRDGQVTQVRAGAPAQPETETAGEAPAAGTGLGISVLGSKRAPTLEEVMRARQRAHLASLSEQTGQNAAANSAVPEAAVPAAIREEVQSLASGQGASEAAPTEMPSALVGPTSLRLAAQRGDASAQFEVAARLAEGKGIKQDFAQAFVWYQRAAAQGLAQAQYRLATLYERGLGIKADLARARVWYRRAAEQGNLKAMHNLAVISAGRDQSQPDYPTAVQWFTAAAVRGLADSQFNLGILHESGLGVARDHVAALKWYSLAANGGDREAARRLDRIRAKMDAVAVKEAEDMVAEWRAETADRMANDPRVAGEAWKQRANAAR